jgi:hypothetical protein
MKLTLAPAQPFEDDAQAAMAAWKKETEAYKANGGKLSPEAEDEAATAGKTSKVRVAALWRRAACMLTCPVLRPTRRRRPRSPRRSPPLPSTRPTCVLSR